MRSILGMTITLTVLNSADPCHRRAVAHPVARRRHHHRRHRHRQRPDHPPQPDVGWILRTITSLFENVGTVQNGIETIARPYSVVDRPKPRTALTVPEGAIRFENVRFHYGKERTASSTT
jgi:ABC-type multidrug transport system fused ATPase/permease subunit